MVADLHRPQPAQALSQLSRVGQPRTAKLANRVNRPDYTFPSTAIANPRTDCQHREDAVTRIRIKTQERYEEIIEQNLIPELGDIPLQALSPRHIEDAYRSLPAHGYDARTIRLINCVMSGACKYAVRREKVDRNAAALVALPTVTKREIIPLEIETVQQLLSMSEAEDHRLFAFLFVPTYTGMRKGKLWGLPWRRVDLVAELIRVVEGTVRTKKQSDVKYRPKTDKGVRSIDLPDVAVDFLRDHRARGGEAVKPDDLAFPGSDGKKMPETTMMRWLKDLGARVGAPDITFHAFHHFLPRGRRECVGDVASAGTRQRHDHHGRVWSSHERSPKVVGAVFRQGPGTTGRIPALIPAPR